jgi:acid phosphatase (class A)
MRPLSALAALAATTALFGSFAAVGQSVSAPANERAMPAPAQARAPAEQASAEARRRSGGGYLKEPLADSLVLSPPPPAPGSPAETRDLEGARDALARRGTARWRLAAQDADLVGAGPAAFSCTAGVAIGPHATPKLNRLLRKALVDLGQSTSAIKAEYSRPRPFMVNGQPTCTPEAETALRRNGSYPSGHSAAGFGWALILAELKPERAGAIVARGRAFGDSRRICNVHWLSDVEEGRIAAAATVARLHADPAFRADLDAARAELAAVRTKPVGCEAEGAALAG